VILLAGLSGAAVVGGLVLLVCWWFSDADAEPARPSRRARRLAAGFGADQADEGQARRKAKLGAAAVLAGALAWWGTGWPVAGLTAAVAVVGVPWLLDGIRTATARIERVEGLEEWIRRVADLVAAGGGLEQSLLRSAGLAPESVSEPVQRLVARLQARWRTEDALRAFADDLSDGASDLVVAALLLGNELRGPGLARVLTELAQTLAAEVATRRQVEADRAKPRANARWLVLITLGASAAAFVAGQYMAPYGTPIGQLMLLGIVSAIAGCLVWLRKIAQTQPDPRFLADTSGAKEPSAALV